VPKGPMRFFADCNVGKLARWLRMLGFDVLYSPDIEDDVLVCQAIRENRIILTRDTEIAFRKAAQRSLFILSDETPEQVRQVITELGLKVDPSRLTPRCALCNEVLEEVPKEAVKDRVPPYTYSTHERFRMCGVCGRIYWHGSHVERVLREAAGVDSGGVSNEDGSSPPLVGEEENISEF
jgi:uncharacterized protein with PIN domain